MKGKQMRKMLLSVLVCLIFCSISTGNWMDDFKGLFKVEGMFDYEIAQTTAFMNLDENGGVGVLFITDSFIPENTEDNMCIGPVAEFKLDKAYKAFFSTVLPWLDLDPNLPATFYGFAGATWETANDHDMLGVLGTKVILFPDRKVSPVIMLEALKGESDSTDIHTLFGVQIGF